MKNYIYSFIWSFCFCTISNSTKWNVSASIPQYHSQNNDYLEVPQIEYTSTNDLEKPVSEYQEYIPNQATVAVIPPMPPPATPVAAAAANIPSIDNSIFLGSGSLGVIDLGGGETKLFTFTHSLYYCLNRFGLKFSM